MAAATNTPVDVLQYLIAEDGYALHEGPYASNGGERAVAYVRDYGAFTDIFRVEVTVHSRGADREAIARRAAVAEESEREYRRVTALLGERVIFRDEPAVLVHVARGKEPDDPIEVGCVAAYGAGPHDPIRGTSDEVTPDGSG